MDQNTLQLTDCIVRYDPDGNLEFVYEGQNKPSSEKTSGPSAISGSQVVTWRVQRDEVNKLKSFIDSHAQSSLQSSNTPS